MIQVLIGGEKTEDIPMYEGLYAVTTRGRVWSYAREGSGGHSGKWMKLKKANDGYLSVTLTRNGSRKKYRINRLVAMVHIKNKLEVNHKDGIKDNNEVSNLEWCTKSMNEIHANRTGLKPKLKTHTSMLGKNFRKLTKQQVIEIRESYKNGLYTQSELGKKYGIDKANVSMVVRRLSYKEIE